jgi:hypothetical protein
LFVCLLVGDPLETHLTPNLVLIRKWGVSYIINLYIYIYITCPHCSSNKSTRVSLATPRQVPEFGENHVCLGLGRPPKVNNTPRSEHYSLREGGEPTTRPTREICDSMFRFFKFCFVLFVSTKIRCHTHAAWGSPHLTNS